LTGRAEIRRTLGWVVVGSLCAAALVAIAGILSGDFDDTDWRLIATSVAVAVFGSAGAAGAALRFRTIENLRTLGLVTVVFSAIAFVLFVVALWEDDSDTAWEWFGVAGLAAFSASHASVVTGAWREADTEAVRVVATGSVCFSLLVSGSGILAIAEAFDEVGDAFTRFVGVTLVLLLLTTALPPIMRRLQGTGGRRRLGEGPAAEAAPPAAAAPPPAAEARAPSAPAPLAAEVIAAVDRILALNGDADDRSSEIQGECERLRELARSYSR
jgi:peptidoglycan/LPS O-acetylase OafA/YrhL